MTECEFEVEVTREDARRFAELSGDWNPLHTDSDYAADTIYQSTILHGAFSAGLLSRMAGMHIPGRDCLLHGIRLKFIAPILLPARLLIRGAVVRKHANGGLVEVTINDSTSGFLYVDGSYEFGYHRQHAPSQDVENINNLDCTEAPILVTGASGGLGSALLKRLGGRGLGLSRSSAVSALVASDLARLPEMLGGRKISGIVHCGWPSPDNQRLIALGSNTEAAVRHHVTEPLSDCLKLAQILSTIGLPGSNLVLVGSTAAEPGRHNWRKPLYSLGKSLVPTLVKALAVELGARNQRCLGVIFDVVDGGMNATMRDAVRIAHADRTSYGVLPTMDDAAGQIAWMLDNNSYLISGAVITLSGGALP